MAVEDARQMADDVVACIEVLEYFCHALEGQEKAGDPERWLEAAANVASRARNRLAALRAEVDDWELTVGMCADALDIDGEEDDEDDLLAEWA